MSLDFYMKDKHCRYVLEENITHNLVPMAKEAGFYPQLWRPDENQVEFAYQILPALLSGINAMETDKQRFLSLNPSNGWGTYDGLLESAKRIALAAIKHPDAHVEASR